MQVDDSIVTKDSKDDYSLEFQIIQARKRAEKFSSSLNEARRQEQTSLKALQLQNEEWVKAYETKSVELEQVERELNAVISSQISKSDAGIRSDINMTDKSEQVSIIDNSLQTENKSLISELLCKTSEFETISLENVELKKSMEVVKRSNNKLSLSLKDAEAKLQLRLSQVLSLSEKNDDFSKRENDFKLQINQLENQISPYKQEISILTGELKASIARIVILEKQLEESTSNSIIDSSQQIKQNKSNENIISDLKSRIDSLQASHKLEMSQIEEKFDHLSNQFKEVEFQKLLLEKNEERLMKLNFDVTSQKDNLANELLTMKYRIEEQDRMIQMLIDRNERTIQQMVEHQHHKNANRSSYDKFEVRNSNEPDSISVAEKIEEAPEVNNSDELQLIEKSVENQSIHIQNKLAVIHSTESQQKYSSENTISDAVEYDDILIRTLKSGESKSVHYRLNSDVSTKPQDISQLSLHSSVMKTLIDKPSKSKTKKKPETSKKVASKTKVKDSDFIKGMRISENTTLSNQKSILNMKDNSSNSNSMPLKTKRTINMTIPSIQIYRYSQNESDDNITSNNVSMESDQKSSTTKQKKINETSLSKNSQLQGIISSAITSLESKFQTGIPVSGRRSSMSVNSKDHKLTKRVNNAAELSSKQIRPASSNEMISKLMLSKSKK